MMENDVIRNQSLENESGGVPSSRMFLLVFGLILFVGFSMACTYYFFASYRDALAKEATANSYSKELRDHKEQQENELNTYGVINAETRVIRLPIEEGIKKALARYN